MLTLGLGLWLVHCAGYSYTAPWIVISLVLLVASSVAGRQGGEREGETRRLASGSRPTAISRAPSCAARMRDPLTLALSWGAGLAGIAILALMIWKPGG